MNSKNTASKEGFQLRLSDVNDQVSQISFQGPGGRQELMNANGERSIEDKASTIVQKIHWTGAFLAFVGGLVWMTIQVERE